VLVVVVRACRSHRGVPIGPWGWEPLELLSLLSLCLLLLLLLAVSIPHHQRHHRARQPLIVQVCDSLRCLLHAGHAHQRTRAHARSVPPRATVQNAALDHRAVRTEQCSQLILRERAGQVLGVEVVRGRSQQLRVPITCEAIAVKKPGFICMYRRG
jgi:hypothetical protein